MKRKSQAIDDEGMASKKKARAEESKDSKEEKKETKSATKRDILESVECSVCMEPISDKIFQCDEGHILCAEDFKRQTTCPICRGTLSQPIRNRALERVRDAFYTRCRFAADGCTTLLDKAGTEDIKAHEVVCFRTRQSQCFDCAEKMQFGDICSHLLSTKRAVELKQGKSTKVAINEHKSVQFVCRRATDDIVLVVELCLNVCCTLVSLAREADATESRPPIKCQLIFDVEEVDATTRTITFEDTPVKYQEWVSGDRSPTVTWCRENTCLSLYAEFAMTVKLD